MLATSLWRPRYAAAPSASIEKVGQDCQKIYPVIVPVCRDLEAVRRSSAPGTTCWVCSRSDGPNTQTPARDPRARRGRRRLARHDVEGGADAEAGGRRADGAGKEDLRRPGRAGAPATARNRHSRRRRRGLAGRSCARRSPPTCWRCACRPAHRCLPRRSCARGTRPGASRWAVRCVRFWPRDGWSAGSPAAPADGRQPRASGDRRLRRRAAGRRRSRRPGLRGRSSCGATSSEPAGGGTCVSLPARRRSAWTSFAVGGPSRG